MRERRRFDAIKERSERRIRRSRGSARITNPAPGDEKFASRYPLDATINCETFIGRGEGANFAARNNNERTKSEKKRRRKRPKRERERNGSGEKKKV